MRNDPHGLHDRVREILADFQRFLNDATAAAGFATLGLGHLASYLERTPTQASNPDPMIFLGVGDPNDLQSQAYANWRRSEALRQLAHPGPVETRLGQQWIVYVYSAWEHDFRARLAAAYGCPKDAVKVPLLGDLRLIRHDVVHHRGIATQDNTGQCTVLRDWFQPGDAIVLQGHHYEQFMRLFPWIDLARAPKALPQG